MVWINGGYYGGMYGFDAYDGEELFFLGLEQYDMWTPAYAEEVLYSFVEGQVRAHDPATGTLTWELDLGWDWHGWDMSTAPVVDLDTIYVTGSPNLYAVDVHTQSVLWSVEGDYEGVPSVADGVVYAIESGAVEAYAASDGAYLGVYVGDSQLWGQPIVTSDVLIASSRYNTYVYDLDGTLLELIGYGGHISLSDGVLYIASTDGQLVTYKWSPPG